MQRYDTRVLVHHRQWAVVNFSGSRRHHTPSRFFHAEACEFPLALQKPMPHHYCAAIAPATAMLGIGSAWPPPVPSSSDIEGTDGPIAPAGNQDHSSSSGHWCICSPAHSAAHAMAAPSSPGSGNIIGTHNSHLRIQDRQPLLGFESASNASALGSTSCSSNGGVYVLCWTTRAKRETSKLATGTSTITIHQIENQMCLHVTCLQSDCRAGFSQQSAILYQHGRSQSFGPPM